MPQCVGELVQARGVRGDPGADGPHDGRAPDGLSQSSSGSDRKTGPAGGWSAVAGPVFLSLPLDDWDKPSTGPAVVRTVGTRVAPDPARLHEVADALRHASSSVLIYGAAIARATAGARQRRWPRR